MAEQGKELPGYVQREFEEFLQCGRLEHGFLRVRCESCHAEHLVAFSCKRVGVELPVSAAFPVWGRLREGAESYAKALASDILR